MIRAETGEETRKVKGRSIEIVATGPSPENPDEGPDKNTHQAVQQIHGLEGNGKAVYQTVDHFHTVPTEDKSGPPICLGKPERQPEIKEEVRRNGHADADRMNHTPFLSRQSP